MADAAPSLSTAERVDAACDRFEVEWKAGQRPSAEQYLAAAIESDREPLLTGLLAIEVELRGEEVTLESLLARFPAYPTVCRAVLRLSAGDTSVSANRTAPETHSEPIAVPDRVGRFEVRAVLGAGAFGRVYRAFDPQLGRDVAVKVPLAGSLQTAVERERFLREARAAATVSHPNVCAIHEIGEHDGTPFIVMAYVAGRSLAEVISNRKEPLPEKQAVKVIRKLTSALAAAHKKGVIHRDLKPANILFDQEGRDVVVTDFGLARAPRQPGATETQSGVIMGSPAYMSPEQARGDAKNVGPAADIFSLGVIFYELLTGRRPFLGDTIEVLMQILHDDPAAPSTLRVGIDPRLEAACLRAMAKEPAARFPSMQAFAATLDDYLRTPDSTVGGTLMTAKAEPAPPLPAPMPAPLPKRHRPRPLWPVFVALLLAGITVFGGIIFFARTPTATVLIQIEVDLTDKSLSFFLDDAEHTGDDLAKPIELKVGKHVLVVKRAGAVVRRYEFAVSKDAGPRIELKEDVIPRQETPKKEQPKQVKRTLEDEDYEFAEWLFSVKANSMDVKVGDRQWVVRNKAGLPKSPFQVININTWGNSQITDDSAGPILRWAARRGVSELSFFGSPVGDATVGELVKLPRLKRLNLGDTKVTRGCVPLLATRTDLALLNLRNAPIRDPELAILGKLVALEVLDLTDTPVTSAGLPALKGLKNLRVLSLLGTQVDGDGLAHLSGLALENVNLSGTKVRGPAGLAKLSELKRLTQVHLEHLSIRDADLAPLATMKNLRTVFLAGNPISDKAIKTLAKLPHLEMLMAGTTLLTDAAIPDLAAIKTLRELWVGETKLTPDGFARLRKLMPACKILPEPTPEPDRTAAEWFFSVGGACVIVTEDNQQITAGNEALLPDRPFRISVFYATADAALTDQGMLDNLKGLREVDFFDTGAKINGTGFACFRTNNRRIGFELYGVPLTDEGLRAIGSIPKLESIANGSPHVTDAGLVHLKGHAEMGRLYISWPKVTDAGFAHLKGLTGIQDLSLGGTQIGDDSLALLAGWDNLDRVMLGGTRVTDAGMRHLTKPKRLRGVNVAGTAVGDAGLEVLKQVPNLQNLWLGRSKVTRAGVAKLHEVKQLREVHLEGLSLTDADVVPLAACRGLTWLNLSDNPITDAGLKSLHGMKTLQILELRSCPKLTPAGVAALEKALPGCKVER